MRYSIPVLVFAAIATQGTTAFALEAGTLGGETLQLDITNASSVAFNVNNRDSRPNAVSTLANDDWGMWYNRLNVQSSWDKWQFGLRLDNAWFYTSPNAVDIATELERSRTRPLQPGQLTPPDYFRARFFEAGEELSTRYVNWLYPAKYYVGYTTRDIEVTVGDFYAQLGRGFVLNVRKQDELASDTTVRGVRLTGRIRSGGLRLRLTGLGGEMNPLRIDEASGRFLGVTSGTTPGLLSLTEAGMPRAQATDFLPEAEPTYAPDRLVAAQIEVGTTDFKFGTQGSMLVRQDALTEDVVRTADRILTGSQSLNIADIGGVASLYVEAAVQDLQHEEQPDADLFGHAFYASSSVALDPVTVTLEGKHYRRFFPMRANVDLTRAREFGLVQYSSAPTTEAFWTDTEFEGFNTCVTGGRAKTDVSLSKHVDAFAWVGRYHTWSEAVANEACETKKENANRVWDLAVGSEITGKRHRSRANVTVGSRFDNTETPIADAAGQLTTVYYQEGYLRFDIIQAISGPYSLQFQGWHRRRRQTQGGPVEPWWEGQQLIGLDIAPELSFAAGVEYSSNPRFAAASTPVDTGDLPDLTLYFNGQAQWRFSSASSVALFVGQRRGSLRCVGGVCRVFPPFEGARLDATMRF